MSTAKPKKCPRTPRSTRQVILSVRARWPTVIIITINTPKAPTRDLGKLQELPTILPPRNKALHRPSLVAEQKTTTRHPNNHPASASKHHQSQPHSKRQPATDGSSVCVCYPVRHRTMNRHLDALWSGLLRLRVTPLRPQNPVFSELPAARQVQESSPSKPIPKSPSRPSW